MEKQFMNAFYMHYWLSFIHMYNQEEIGHFQKWATDGLQFMTQTLKVNLFLGDLQSIFERVKKK